MRAAASGVLLMVVLSAACSSGSTPTPESPTPTASGTPTANASPDARYVEVTASTCLNIRARPTLDAAVIGCAPSGTVLIREGGPREADGRRWLRVGGAFQGWAAAEFLQATDRDPDQQS